MLALPLLVTTLTLAPTGVGSRVDLYVGGDLALTSWRYPPPPGWVEVPGGSATGGDAGAGVTVYLRRVIDDDAPPSLQPYLQRASSVHIDGGGSGYDQSNPASNLPASSGHGGYVDFSAAGYSGRWLYGSVGIGVSYREDDAPSGKLGSSLTLPVGLAGGLRVGALRLTAGWSIAPIAVDDQPFRVDFWGGAYVTGYGVVREKLGLGATVQVLDGGAFVNGDATLYLARRFGIGAYVHGAHSTPHAVVTNDVGAGVNFEAWLSSRVALRVSYHFDWYHYDAAAFSDEQNSYASVISLQAQIRPR